MSFDAAMFLDAQDRVWDSVVNELSAGRKTSHWMWFVFPQLASLGRSAMAKRYGLENLEEAGAYLSIDRLRTRLEEAAQLVLGHPESDAQDIFGQIDALKLRSSMTLFSRVPNADPVFQRVLDTFYRGQPCKLTLAAMRTN